MATLQVPKGVAICQAEKSARDRKSLRTSGRRDAEETGTRRRIVSDSLVLIAVACGALAQLDRALASGARGRRFESCMPHHTK